MEARMPTAPRYSPPSASASTRACTSSARLSSTMECRLVSEPHPCNVLASTPPTLACSTALATACFPRAGYIWYIVSSLGWNTALGTSFVGFGSAAFFLADAVTSFHSLPCCVSLHLLVSS